MSRNAFWYSIETMNSKELETLQRMVDECDLTTLAKEKLRSVINYVKEELDNRDFFPITSLHKDDIKGQFSEHKDKEKIFKVIDNLTNSDMEYLASKMADCYCDTDYWITLENLFKDYYLERKK